MFGGAGLSFVLAPRQTETPLDVPHYAPSEATRGRTPVPKASLPLSFYAAARRHNHRRAAYMGSPSTTVCQQCPL